MPDNRPTAGAAAAAPSKAKRWALLAFLSLNTLLFCSLGSWQLQRLGWKKDLIARVQARVQASPEAPPTPAQWPQLGAGDEYRRLQLAGQLLTERSIPVYANTDLGPGYWLMAPLQLTPQPGAANTNPSANPSATPNANASADAHAAAPAVVWINRGFIPTAMRHSPDYARLSAPAAQAERSVQVTGLLRLPPRPHWFLRENRPAEQRWYQRNPAELSAAQALPGQMTAPYFVDAQQIEPSHTLPSAGGSTALVWPRPGLTQLQFRNNHLSYALTWFTLALLNIAALLYLLYFEPRRARSGQHKAAD
ncbi:MAG: SURF1 family cytochrome oxidase biogenesis protein [Comamonadaceae bacterium]|nr:SURF1 family cytochrome oxidase biogenesis protein [Comamonadaceae bacterium]